MKNSADDGFDQQDNTLVAVEHGSRLIVGQTLSAHPTDQREAAPTVDAIPPAVGKPTAAALDAGFFSQANIDALVGRGIEPYIATGREPHQPSWHAYVAAQPAPPPTAAGPKEQMASTLKTEVGTAIYRPRKCTVEPVIGIIKETLGFRQCSSRGLAAAAGEWGLVCLAYNLKRLHVLGLG